MTLSEILVKLKTLFSPKCVPIRTLEHVALRTEPAYWAERKLLLLTSEDMKIWGTELSIDLVANIQIELVSKSSKARNFKQRFNCLSFHLGITIGDRISDGV